MVEPSENIGKIFLEQLIDYTVFALEAIITIIIIIIVAITLVDLFRMILSSLIKKEGQQPTHILQIVSRMLRGLLISLDFLIAADILKTILNPSVTELTILVIIVAIRILLSWSLSKEIQSKS